MEGVKSREKSNNLARCGSMTCVEPVESDWLTVSRRSQEVGTG